MAASRPVKAHQSSANMEVTATNQEGIKVVRVRRPDDTFVQFRRQTTTFSKSDTAPTASSPEVYGNRPDKALNETKDQYNEPIPLRNLSTAIPELGDVKVTKTIIEVPRREPVIETSSSVSGQKSVGNGSDVTTSQIKPTSSIQPGALRTNHHHQYDRFRGLSKRGISNTLGSLSPDWQILDDEDWTKTDDDHSKFSEDSDRDDSNDDQTNARRAHGNNGVANGPRDPEKQADRNNRSNTIKPRRRAGRVLPRPYLLTKLIIWTITICLPTFFIILGISCAILDGKPAGSYYNPIPAVSYFNQALQIAITSWPIVFAAIVAQSLKAFASYKVERGVRLMTLEQLIGSNSVAGAVKQPFSLRKFDSTSIALLALWALSPLTSQAMQRMSDTVSQSPSRDTTLRVVDTTGSNNNLNPNVSLADYRNSISTMFGAAILPRGMQDLPYMDPWGYPLIPAVHLLAQNETAQPDNWYDVDVDNVDASSYSSPLGIPYTPFDNNTETYNFIIKSSYFNFTCLDISSATMDVIAASPGVKLVPSETGTLYMDMNIPQHNTNGNLTFASLITKAITSFNGTIYQTNRTFAYSTCNFTQLYVESNTTCENYPGYTDCSVSAARLTTPPPDPAPLQAFHKAFINAGTPAVVPGISRSNTPTLIERYLADPAKVLHEMTDINLSLQLNDTDTLEQRLGKLFNTFWQTAFDPMYQTGFEETPDDLKLHLNFTNGQNHHNVSTLLLNATVTLDTVTFVVYKPWLALELICSVLLLIAGVVGLIWESQTIGSNVLGFASSIIRQNRYIELPKDSGAMTGPERANAVKNLIVMVQDVRPDADVGKIALGTVRDSSRGLEVGRLYG